MSSGASQHLQVVGHDDVAGIKPLGLPEVRQRFPKLTAQHMGVTEVVVVLRRAAGELEERRLDAVGQVEATQAIVGRTQADIALRVLR